MTNDQTVTQAPFVREERYIVIKRSHLSEGKESDLRTAMDEIGIDTVDCVVVEADWPEYEPVWQMIEDHMSGRTAHSGDLAPGLERAAQWHDSRCKGPSVFEQELHEVSAKALRHLAANPDATDMQSLDAAHSGEGRDAIIERCARIADGWNRGRDDRVTETSIAAAIRDLSGEGRSNGAEVRDEIHDALVRAYSQGANDVHAEWQKHWESGDGYGPPDPDFTESSHDYAASEMPGLGAAIAALSAPQGEVEREAFRPMSEWDQRDETVLLLVDYADGEHPLDDATVAITIGHNNDHHIGPDEADGWKFAGWCWSHDHYVEGKGTPIGWMPLPHHLAALAQPEAGGE